MYRVTRAHSALNMLLPTWSQVIIIYLIACNGSGSLGSPFHRRSLS